MTDDGHIWTSVAEAARLLRKSERTIRRWVSANKLPCKDNTGQKLVGLAPELVEASASAGQKTDMSDMARLREEAARLRTENEKLSTIVRQLSEERDYLRQALAVALSNQRLLVERIPKRQPWRERLAFWR